MNYEMSSYPKNIEVPEYRIINASIVGTIKTHTMIINNYDIPLPLEDKKNFASTT